MTTGLPTTTAAVTTSYFSGMSHVYGRGNKDLANIIRGILQVQAKQACVTEAALTDDSGGTSGGNTVAAIPSSFVATAASGSNLAPKAGFDTQWADAVNAISTLAAYTNVLLGLVPAWTVTDDTGGTSGSGTVGAISATLTAVGVSSSSLAAAEASVMAAGWQADFSELIFAVNKLCVATGTTPLTDSTGASSILRTGTLAALPANSGTAGSGLTADSVTNTAAEAWLTAARNAVATVAAKLNAIVAHSGNYLSLPAGVAA